MPGPVEVRQFLRLITLQDIADGVQPIRQMTAQGPQLFAPPQLQYRYKMRGEGATVQWSDWIDVLFERQGDAPPH